VVAAIERVRFQHRKLTRRARLALDAGVKPGISVL
jgi:hypothetical protein